MGLTLAIDTTGRGGSVALAHDGRVLSRVDHDPERGYAESLFGLFDEVLREAGADRSDLDRVAVVEGPGSFTGLRVGVMTAKTLARARGWGLWTADALELSLPEQPSGEVVVAIAAGRGHVWAAHFRAESTSWRREGPIQRVDREELEAWADSLAARSLWVENADAGGSGVRPLSERLALRVDQGRWPAREVDPRALIPLYTAPSQAERAHGLDLGEAIHRPTRPVSWD